MSGGAIRPELRPAEPRDLDAVWQLETEVFGAEAWSRAMLDEELRTDHRRYLVLTGADGALLGYGGMLLVGTEADIQTIAVHPSLRGSGQGRRLMTALLEYGDARGAREVFLEVRADNDVAHGLYASLGFHDIGVRPRYYQPEGVDAIVMRLDLRAWAAALHTAEETE